VPVVRDVFLHYYSGSADCFALFRGQTSSDERLAETIAPHAERHERLWFIDSRLWHMDEGRRTPGFLEHQFRELDRRQFAGVTLTLYALDETVSTER
jgi:hypothetical protein